MLAARALASTAVLNDAKDGACEALLGDLALEVAVFAWTGGAAALAEPGWRRYDNGTGRKVAPANGADRRVAAKGGDGREGEGGGDVERASAWNDHRGVVCHMGGELAQIPLATGVVKAGVIENGGRPGIEELAFGGDAGGDEREAGLIEQQGGQPAVDSGREVARIAGAAGVNADQIQTAETGGHFGAGLLDFAVGEDKIGLEAIGGNAGGAGAIERDV